MPSTATLVDIFNMALGQVGAAARLTTTTTPPGREQELCNRYWPLVRDSVLEVRAWSFATRRADLTAVSNPDPLRYGHWAYSYVVPTECLRILHVLPATEDEGNRVLARRPTDFITELWSTGDLYLFTDTEDAVLHYIERVADVTRYSNLFVQAVIDVLAARLATSYVKGDAGAKLAQVQNASAAAFIRLAAANDGDQSYINQEQPLMRQPSHISARG